MTERCDYIYFISLSIISAVDLWLDESQYTIGKKDKGD